MKNANGDNADGKEKTQCSYYTQHPSLRKLTPVEKKYLLAVEHGDAATVRRILSMASRDPTLPLDVNCKDSVGRSAIVMAIDNENLEMLQLLLDFQVESRDALLHAINAQNVEAVELLLDHEESVHKPGEPHSWEKIENDISSFAPEITPLILAAHKDNYEILKILLDRGATLPMPHDVRCCCRECVQAMNEDCLCHSRSRINAYRALSSPSLICLSSIDPILTAFELSWELGRLSLAEPEFREDYQKLRVRCQDFATALLAQIRSSRELSVLLNHDPLRPPEQSDADSMPLARVEMALKYKQKKFIAHPNVQQLLSTLWYDGLPGFRQLSSVQQLWEIMKIGVLFPLYSVLYMVSPHSAKGKLIRKPFFKFILHSFSYLFFLFLLILASQRVETVVVQIFGTERMKMELAESLKKQRGQPPTVIETSILLFIIAHIWQETRELWKKGLLEYFHNMWNVIDFTRNLLHCGTACLRLLAYVQAQAEIRHNPMAVYIPREAWDAFDPMLIADGLFAAGNVFAALKLVHIFSINPYLGPLQISLGRMVIDIIKFFFIYTLVLFAFACGLNQLLWYYSDMEKKQCFTGPGGTENWATQRDSCIAWRRFSNLFESSQTLFWATFGLVDISTFELSGIKSYTRFWGLLMFGSYSVINVVVLLNLLIAMMSNSYQLISERADEEWKFARTKLFMSYFEEGGGTVPPPFNIFPTFKNIVGFLRRKDPAKMMSLKRKETKAKERDSVYQSVMCNLVWRYVTAQQKACESSPVTEDHITELRQDVSSFRHDLMHVLRCNGMNTKGVSLEKVDVTPAKVQLCKRRLINDFSIGLMEVCAEDAAPEIPANRGVLARLVGLSNNENTTSQRWRELIQLAKKSKIIGNRDSPRISRQSTLCDDDMDMGLEQKQDLPQLDKGITGESQAPKTPEQTVREAAATFKLQTAVSESKLAKTEASLPHIAEESTAAPAAGVQQSSSKMSEQSTAPSPPKLKKRPTPPKPQSSVNLPSTKPTTEPQRSDTTSPATPAPTQRAPDSNATATDTQTKKSKTAAPPPPDDVNRQANTEEKTPENHSRDAQTKETAITLPSSPGVEKVSSADANSQSLIDFSDKKCDSVSITVPSDTPSSPDEQQTNEGQGSVTSDTTVVLSITGPGTKGSPATVEASSTKPASAGHQHAGGRDPEAGQKGTSRIQPLVIEGSRKGWV